MVMSMFKDVVPFVKPKPKVEVPRPDNVVFRLHYRFTFAILLIGCVLVSTYSYIDSSGSAIQCMLNKGSMIPGDVINRFCWIQSTFTLPKYYEGEPGVDYIHPGVGPYEDEDEQVYHAYYQWVPLMLFFQALCFYAPHWIWKQAEGNRMKHIIVGLNKYDIKENEEDREKKVGKLAEYMKERKDLKYVHRSWAAKFFVCECLNFINVVAQIFITDVFLGGEFTQYGIKVVQFAGENPEDRIDPMALVFPRMTKCTFYKYGGSGTLQKMDALCVLGMNILNEKIYVFLWFWFVILAIITGINLVMRGVQLCMPNMRNRFVLLESRGYLDQDVNKTHVEQVVRSLTYADWLIFYYLAQSMDKKNFRILIRQMADDPELPGYQTPTTDEDEIDSPDATLPSKAKLPKSNSFKMRMKNKLSS